MVSARALFSFAPIEGSVAQRGTRPQRASAAPPPRTMSTCDAGAMLKRGAYAGISDSPKYSATTSGWLWSA